MLQSWETWTLHPTLYIFNHNRYKFCEALWVNWEKKLQKLNTLARVTHSPHESRNCFTSSLTKSHNVSNNMSGLNFQLIFWIWWLGHLHIRDHLFLNVIKSACTGTGRSSCSKCLILSVLLVLVSLQVFSC